MNETRTGPEVNRRDQRWLFVLLLFPLLVWVMIVYRLMIVDVWDETRGMQLIYGHDALRLIASNWMQSTVGGTILFRPLPFLFVTFSAQLIRNPEVLWRFLRVINACLILVSAGLLLDSVRRWRGSDFVRDAAFALGLLFSGSAIITIGWFANIFDASALLCISWSLWLLAKERWAAAGFVLGLGFFCKEVAVVGFVAFILLGFTSDIEWRRMTKSLVVSFLMLLLFIVCRVSLIEPGSTADLRSFSFAGLVNGLLFFPETFFWQRADVALPLFGTLVLVTVVCLMRSLRSAGALLLIVIAGALLYGPLVHLGATGLIDPGNFAARLYLVPGALVLFFIAMHGRRFALWVVLPLLLWGGSMTAMGHARFQAAYYHLYEAAAASREAPPVRVSCELYGSDFRDERHGVWLGIFPDAGWRFETDGRVMRRSIEDDGIDWQEYSP